MNLVLMSLLYLNFTLPFILNLINFASSISPSRLRCWLRTRFINHFQPVCSANYTYIVTAKTCLHIRRWLLVMEYHTNSF